MAYTVPDFNVLCDVWSVGTVPDDDAPAFENVACQFYIYSRGSWDIQPCELELYHPPIGVRFPVAAATPWEDGQVFEVPPGSGRYYRARFKERVHLGFPNEYLVCYVVQCQGDGRPIARDIENAEPCGEAPSLVGEGALVVTLNTDWAGDWYVEAGPPDFEGEGAAAATGEGTISGVGYVS